MSNSGIMLNLTQNQDYKSNCHELNSYMFDMMEALNYQSTAWPCVIKLNDKISKGLQRNYQYKQALLNSSILCVVPLMSSKLEWDQLLNGDVNRLQESFTEAPQNVSSSTAMEIKYLNKFYLKHIIDCARTSPIAALELGVSEEIIEILRGITVDQKNHAYQFKLPLFKWRYENTTIECEKVEFSELEWIMYLIKSTPINLLSLDQKSDIAKRYNSEHAYPYAEKLVEFGMRATIIHSLLPNMHPAKIRDLYMRTLNISSSCGKLPTSATWYFGSETRRTHSSFIVLLYRLAYRAGLQHIPAIIAAYSWYKTMVSENLLPIDRTGFLINSAQSGSGTVYVAACRDCKANYLLCNTADRNEFSLNYHCPVCAKKNILQAA